MLGGPLGGDVATNQGEGVAGDLANEFLEESVIAGPCLDVLDQAHRHIDRAGAALLFEGEVPARSSATGAFKLAQVAFQEGAGLGDLAEGEIAGEGVAIGGGRFRFHIQYGTILIHTGQPEKGGRAVRAAGVREGWNPRGRGGARQRFILIR